MAAQTSIVQSKFDFVPCFQLWGRTLLDSFRAHAGQPDEDEEMSSDSEIENTEDAGPASRTRSRQRQTYIPFGPTRARIQVGRNNVHMMPPIES